MQVQSQVQAQVLIPCPPVWTWQPPTYGTLVLVVDETFGGSFWHPSILGMELSNPPLYEGCQIIHIARSHSSGLWLLFVLGVWAECLPVCPQTESQEEEAGS